MQTVKRGVTRRAYWVFRRHFPDLADQIYGTLDIAAQRALERERDGGSTEERRATVVAASRIQRSPGSIQKTVPGMRSVSAVDTAAAQRAARAVRFICTQKAANAGPSSTNSGIAGSLPRPRIGTCQQQAATHTGVTPRTRGRTGVSQSQPGSRSTSPSSKLREQHIIGSYYRPTGTIPKKASGIPRSLANSRETSPTRAGGGVIMKRSIYTTGNSRRTPERNQPTRQLAAARLLQQSRDAENALADALSPDGNTGDYASMNDYSRERGGFSVSSRMGRKLMSREESDDSEASSVCSERSFDSSIRVAIIQQHIGHKLTFIVASSSSSPKPLQSPNVGGPFSSLQPQFNNSRQSSVADNELILGYSQVDIQQNIQKTTEEIRNCFGGIENQSMTNNSNGGGYNGHLNEALDSCALLIRRLQSATTTESNTPESTTMRLDSNLLDQNYKMSQYIHLFRNGQRNASSSSEPI
ncbi:CLIP-associating protein [Eumeta japonica]|uniref:CLIP-associating protein n=1 Tax=Eumeta variegata TaxID=151549 RepID=A0A4C1SFK4_EUMVA|nr:CLIP-associating protein [Eumeta japonica]